MKPCHAANNFPARIADSSSINAVNFSSACTTKRFPSSRCASATKTARRRFIKIQPNLREWLLPVRKHSGRVTCEEFRRQFDTARPVAGITDWPDNALRHSFASYHLAHFKDQNSLALEMGHTDSEMIFSNYRQLVRPKDAERYWKIAPAVSTEKIVQMPESRAEIKERLRHGEVKEVKPNPNPGTGESFIVTLKPERRSAKH